jgi:tRNA(adenine34) deaminase
MERSEEEIDQYFMKEALKEAMKAFEADEVPVGAVLVQNGRIIARAHNQVELLQDATAHAEILCITSASAQLENWRLEGATLYCTLEPCSMCAGAILASRIQRIVWAAPDVRLGANGSWVNLFSIKHPMHEVEVKSLVLAEESAFLMKEFFKTKRKKKTNAALSY